MTGQVLEAVISLSEIAEIELVILKRLKERTVGDHTSVAKGPGHDFVGTREWEPSDRVSSIDWAQSSLTNFSPIITREFDQNSRATVLAVADGSLSTRCGIAGLTIGHAIARCIATFGLSATFFQDAFGLLLFDRHGVAGSIRPRIGRPHVLHCLDVYNRQTGSQTPGETSGLVDTIASHLRQPTLLPVISDFLSTDALDIVADLARLNGVHDVLLVVTNARAAYRLPAIMDRWVRVADVETGEMRVLSHAQCEQLEHEVEEWQSVVARRARDLDLDIVRVDLDGRQLELALTAFVAERRGRKL
jgi:uncharacterized protein (DUF58 family)